MAVRAGSPGESGRTAGWHSVRIMSPSCVASDHTAGVDRPAPGDPAPFGHRGKGLTFSVPSSVQSQHSAPVIEKLELLTYQMFKRDQYILSGKVVAVVRRGRQLQY